MKTVEHYCIDCGLVHELLEYRPDGVTCSACNGHLRPTCKALSNQDPVNHPSHYMGKVECIDAIETATDGLDGFEAYCTGNILKYIWRWRKKNGLEDLKKAKWYLERLIKQLEG